MLEVLLEVTEEGREKEGFVVLVVDITDGDVGDGRTSRVGSKSIGTRRREAASITSLTQ